METKLVVGHGDDCTFERGEEMTLAEAAKGVITRGKNVYNIGFNHGDETELDATGLAGLEEAWKEFCKDNNLAEDCVDYVEVGKTDFEGR